MEVYTGDYVDTHGVFNARVVSCSHLVQMVGIKYWDPVDGGYVTRNIRFREILRVHGQTEEEPVAEQLELSLGVDPIAAGLAFPTVK